MRAFIKYFSQDQGDESTVNVKRTTLATAGFIVLAILSGVSLLAFYASFKAMSAASAVDDAWQSQLNRIVDIEANAVQAHKISSEVKAGQSALQQSYIDLRNRTSQLQRDVNQIANYRANRDAEQAAAKVKADEEQAEAQRQIEAAEKKGVENFDRLLLARLHSRWVRPESITVGSTVEVLVEFAPDGTIRNASVPKSSGSKDFDHSVVKAAAVLARIPEMATVSAPIYNKYLSQRLVKFEG